MNINLVIISEKTPSFYNEARKEYEKRLGRFCKLKIVCAKNQEKAKKSLNRKSPVVVVCSTGQTISSEGLAEKISSAENSGVSSINIIVGEDYVSEPDDIKLSVSQFSLSSDLVSVIVLEQIYRAYKIISGETYHK